MHLANNQMLCPVCNTNNNKEDAICRKCGALLPLPADMEENVNVIALEDETAYPESILSAIQDQDPDDMMEVYGCCPPGEEDLFPLYPSIDYTEDIDDFAEMSILYGCIMYDEQDDMRRMLIDSEFTEGIDSQYPDSLLESDNDEDARIAKAGSAPYFKRAKDSSMSIRAVYAAPAYPRKIRKITNEGTPFKEEE